MMGQSTYAVFLLGWALPVIVLQWLVGRHVLRAHWRTLILGVLIPTAWLASADVLAIRVGIWSFNPDLTLGIWIGGLPLEEGLFFLVTNVMVVQGVLLVAKPPVAPRTVDRAAMRPEG